MTIANTDKLADFVEIDLLYAQAEMKAAATDPAALVRAVRHIEHALKAIRAHNKRKNGKPKFLETDAA